jgi:hypothetical protein
MSVRIPNVAVNSNDAISKRDMKRLKALEGIIQATFGTPMAPAKPSSSFSTATSTSFTHGESASSSLWTSSVSNSDLIEMGELLSKHGSQMEEPIREQLKRKFNDDVKKKYGLK